MTNLFKKLRPEMFKEEKKEEEKPRTLEPEKTKEEIFQERKDNPELAEIQDTITLRASVLSCLAQKNPDRNKATELLTNAVKREFIFYSIRSDLKEEMWVYDNGIYIPNGRSFIEEFCRKILQEAYTEGLSKAVFNKVKEDTLIRAEDFFKYDNPEEVCVLNGILNTTTKQLISYNPKKIFFNKIPVVYDSKAECPKLDKYYKDVLAEEEDIKVMHEFLGDALSKRYDYQKAIIQYGDGSNSKGISQSIIKKFFGIDNVACVSLNQMTYDSHSIADLFGKFVNVAGDLDRQALKETGIFKQLRSGTDSIQAKRKYLNDLKFMNFAKMIFACNEFPRVYDTSFGFWRSWIILNYPYKFISQEEYNLLEDKGNFKIKNPDIFEEVTTEEEMSGLLNKSLEGLNRLRKNKGYSTTKGTEEIKNFWIRKSSPFTAFCIDCLEQDNENKITKKELRSVFSKYCKVHKIGGAGDKELKATLQDLFGASEDRKMMGDFENKNYESIWEGIKFKDNYKELLKEGNKNNRVERVFPETYRTTFPIDFKKNPNYPVIFTPEDKKIEEEIEE